MPIQELQNYNGNGVCKTMKFHGDQYKSTMIKWAKLGGWTVSDNKIGGIWKIYRKKPQGKYSSLSKIFNKTM